jgi:hypothetical protein
LAFYFLGSRDTNLQYFTSFVLTIFAPFVNDTVSVPYGTAPTLPREIFIIYVKIEVTRFL